MNSCPLCDGKKDIEELDELDYFELCPFHFWLIMEQNSQV